MSCEADSEASAAVLLDILWGALTVGSAIDKSAYGATQMSRLRGKAIVLHASLIASCMRNAIQQAAAGATPVGDRVLQHHSAMSLEAGPAMIQKAAM